MKQRFLSLAVLVLTMATVLIAVTGTTAGAITWPSPSIQLAQPQDSDITDTSIRLSWNAVLENYQYVVYRKPYGGEYEAVTVLGHDTASYTDKGLKNRSHYYYKVVALGPGGNMSSNEVEVWTKFPKTIATDLRATADSSGAITLTWKDNCNSEDVWIISYIGPDGGENNLKIVSTTSEQVGQEVKYNFGKGEPGGTYIFWVNCKRVEGEWKHYSSISQQATVTVPLAGGASWGIAKPDAPSGLTATAVSGSAVTLLWTDNSGNEEGFKIERKAGSGSFEEVATAGADSTSYTDTGLSSGTAYHYRVTAYNSGGSSNYSNEASVNTPGDMQATKQSEEPQAEEKPLDAATIGQIEIIFYVNNKTYLLNRQPGMMDAPPVIMESRTLLPIRYVAEPLGAAVKWYPDAEQVTISLDGKYIELWIGNNAATVNGQNVFIDSANPKVTPMILPPGRTMLPLRFIAENLGCKVDWDGTANMAKVTYPKP